MKRETSLKSSNTMTEKKVLRSYPIPRRPATAPGEVVLRKWCEGKWAVHFHNLEDGGYYHGHYFDDLDAATVGYEKLLAKYSA